MNTILFLAGGTWQVPFLKYLKSKGNRVILVDPFEDCPGSKYADEHIIQDVKNVNKIYELAQDIKIDLILTDQTDVSVIPCALLNEKFGLNQNSIKAVTLFSDKSKSREYALKLGKPHVPQYELGLNKDEIKKMLSSVGKLIIKPVDAQSSRGVYLIETDLDVDKYYELSISASPTKKVIIEEFISGTEITVEGLCINGKHKSLTSSRKKHFKTGIASDLFFPSQIKESLISEIFQFNDTYVERSGLKNGITHAEYIINEDTNSFHLVEIAARGGGTLISSTIVPEMTKINVYENYYLSALSNSFQPDLNNDNNSCCLLHFFDFNQGKVKKISGVNDVINLDYVLEFGLNFQEGETISDVKDDRSRHGFIIIKGSNSKEIDDNLERVYQLINIEYEVQ